MATEQEKSGAKKHAELMASAPQWRLIAKNAPYNDPAYVDPMPKRDPQYIGISL